MALTEEQKAKMQEGRRKAAEKRAADAQKRSERKSKDKRGPARAGDVWPAGLTRNDVVALTEAGVLGVDATLHNLAPQSWTEYDRLNRNEANLLAVNIAREVERSPAALRAIAQLTRVGQRAGLVGALVVIAAPRLRNRGMVPEFLVGLVNKLTGQERAERIVPPERNEGREADAQTEAPHGTRMATPEATEASDLSG